MAIAHQEARMTEELRRKLRALEPLMVEEDNENMDSDWHRRAMNLLIESVCYHFRDRSDFHVGGNMFIYFNEEVIRKKNFRGPDFFFVWGVPREPLRRYWVPWNEGDRYPDVIIELVSPTTAREDRGKKKEICEQIFRTHEYYCYDPDAEAIEGWRLTKKGYRPIRAEKDGRLWCEKLLLFLGKWQGTVVRRSATWLRFFDAGGQVVRTYAEAAQEAADAATRRAEAAEAELARLKARQKKKANGRGNNHR